MPTSEKVSCFPFQVTVSSAADIWPCGILIFDFFTTSSSFWTAEPSDFVKSTLTSTTCAIRAFAQARVEKRLAHNATAAKVLLSCLKSEKDRACLKQLLLLCAV